MRMDISRSPMRGVPPYPQGVALGSSITPLRGSGAPKGRNWLAQGNALGNDGNALGNDSNALGGSVAEGGVATLAGRRQAARGCPGGSVVVVSQRRRQVAGRALHL